VKRVLWSETALKGLAKLDKESVRRINQAVERLAQTNVGDVKKLQAIDPPEYRLRVGNYRVRFYQDDETIRILRIRNRREAYR
jgi:mRNA interferase RelE/StbE